MAQRPDRSRYDQWVEDGRNYQEGVELLKTSKRTARFAVHFRKDNHGNRVELGRLMKRYFSKDPAEMRVVHEAPPTPLSPSLEGDEAASAGGGGTPGYDSEGEHPDVGAMSGNALRDEKVLLHERLRGVDMEGPSRAAALLRWQAIENELARRRPPTWWQRIKRWWHNIFTDGTR